MQEPASVETDIAQRPALLGHGATWRKSRAWSPHEHAIEIVGPIAASSGAEQLAAEVASAGPVDAVMVTALVDPLGAFEAALRAFGPACLVAEIVGYVGNIAFDRSKPDGAPHKLLDVSKLAALGWRARTPLREGLKAAYADFVRRIAGDTLR